MILPPIINKQPANVPHPMPDGSEGYLLTEDCTYTWDMPDKIRRSLKAPKGFLYDGASVPQLVTGLLGIERDGTIRLAATMHDLIYRHNGKLPRGLYGGLKDGVWVDYTLHHWTRADADRLFARIMRETGYTPYKRRAAYLGVRAGGWASWHGAPAKREKMVLNK